VNANAFSCSNGDDDARSGADVTVEMASLFYFIYIYIALGPSDFIPFVLLGPKVLFPPKKNLAAS